MITLITGAPGAGKTAACVQLLMQFVAEGRAIFVNGIPDLKVTHLELVDPHNWMTEVPDGSVIVIDEVQRIWRPAGSGSAVPASIEKLETHRHQGIEFVLMTQHPNLMHANVRRLVGRYIHLRDVGFLGRHWYEWPEAVNPESWKSAPIKKSFKLPKKTFRMYKSASLHVKPVRSVPRSLVAFVICVPLLCFLGYKVYSRISGFTDGKETKNLDLAKAKSKGEPVKLAALDPEIKKPKVLPMADQLERQPEPEAKTLAGCIHFGNRCECVDDKGFSIQVDLKICLDSSARSGLAIPYSVQASGAGNKKPAVAGQMVERKKVTTGSSSPQHQSIPASPRSGDALQALARTSR